MRPDIATSRDPEDSHGLSRTRSAPRSFCLYDVKSGKRSGVTLYFEIRINIKNLMALCAEGLVHLRTEAREEEKREKLDMLDACFLFNISNTKVPILL